MRYLASLFAARRSSLSLMAITLSAALVTVTAAGPRFYRDDPIAREPESQDASGVQPTDIGLFYELTTNLFVTAKHEASGTRAGNVNTIDEVPDSSWFTNRIGVERLSTAQVARGPVAGPPPAPERWVIVREKNAGANPGFTAKDANGETWFVGFDPPSYPEGATGAVVIASKLFWALGYNQVEMFLTTFDPAKATFDEKATKRRPSGDRTPWTRSDLNEILEGVAPNADGTYRVAAGRLLSGKVVGAFRYEGTRSDDPNDIVPHQHRRELRALRVFGAWTNLTDLKAGNTLDVLVTENGRLVVKHVLQDVGSTFGMANRQYEWDLGWEYFYEAPPSRRRLLSFGFARSPWQTTPYTAYPSIGRFEGDRFDPRAWRPQTPVTAYMELREDDAFWAARRVMAFSDELIGAAVHAGQYSDPAAERHLAAVLAKRRDAIGRAYLSAINPIVDPRLDADGRLTFANAAVDAGFADRPTEYRATWFRFDNATGATQPLGASQSATTTMPPPGTALPTAPGSFVQVDLVADSPRYASWREPVHAFFRRDGAAWKLVGLERLPAGQSAASSSRSETGRP
jgi:hypothetical protein